MILWFKADRTKGFWIDPPWRIESDGAIEATSAELPWELEEAESEEQYKKRFQAACSRSDHLEAATLSSVAIDTKTSDLRLSFDNGRVLRTFIVRPDEENWHFSDYETERQYVVLASGVEVKPLQTENRNVPEDRS